MKTDRKEDKDVQDRIHNEVKKTVEECTGILNKAYDKVIDRYFDEAFNNDKRE